MTTSTQENDPPRGARPAAQASGAGNVVLTPTTIARLVKDALEALGGGIVEGEVISAQVSGRGHRYFTLSDGRTQIDCFTWEASRAEVDPFLRLGGTVRARFTRVGYMDRSGRVSLTVEEVRPVGEGEILREMAATLARLVGDGLTDPARKRPLPAYPAVVGVVAGRDSDAMADVVSAIRARFPPARVRTMPAVVEGARAVDSVTGALARICRVPGVEVVVIARGGGSVEALRPFSDERLCRAIAAAPVPVVTSIGHTKQRPNCDHVADAAAHVPRQAAELVVPSAEELRARLGAALDRLAAPAQRVARAGERIDLVGRTLAGYSSQRLAGAGQGLAAAALRLDRLRLRLPAARDLDVALGALRADARRLRDRLASGSDIVARVGGAVALGGRAALADARERLRAAAHPLNERDALAHGYALVHDQTGSPVLSALALSPGDDVTIRFADGAASARVTGVRREVRDG